MDWLGEKKRVLIMYKSLKQEQRNFAWENLEGFFLIH